MAAESTFLSQTLQSITTTKMREQSKRRQHFEARKSELLQDADSAVSQQTRLKVLLSGFDNHSTSNKGVWYIDDERKQAVQNATRYLEQSFHDPSVSLDILQDFENGFRAKLDQESQRNTFADLYYRLLEGELTLSAQPRNFALIYFRMDQS